MKIKTFKCILTINRYMLTINKYMLTKRDKHELVSLWYYSVGGGLSTHVQPEKSGISTPPTDSLKERLSD